MGDQYIEIDNLKLKLIKIISEGGFGTVFLVESDDKNQ